ncbi:toxin-antitoxin system YwqK family antitoxin [Pedobacter alpinus]|uniref:Toxin-antitoxin system YwqK family antitoxin n=1 Tax=Pedobacter alpinus TaxID=1590643 RepID=A0ABW5TVX1_9SPHI
MKIRFYLYIVGFIGLIIILLNQKPNIQKMYFTLFNKTGTTSTYKEDGEILNFTNGKLVFKGNLENGKVEGLVVYYFENGKVKTKMNFHEGRANGKTIKYFENGNIEHVSNWKNGKRYGEVVFYSEDGKLIGYNVFDITQTPFYGCDYTPSNDVKPDEGSLLVSLNIFSFDILTDSTEILQYQNKYKNIKDLFITVATPPKASLKLNIQINNKEVRGFKIVNNTIRVPDAFLNEGKYHVNIVSKLFNKDNIAIDSLISGTSFSKME